ncbi:GDP-mannose 4,6-dehydratase [Stutzerimonas stutzeri]|uniref:GDP-mannose 4,6-dehydratase n=1 Tax=Stutzerimonas stutzeri TaxID=316 RepID=UPI00210CCE85|nr:GDP-mannose 4,6-dehydratase [Stutzerimonas stutzeri]MCQ4322423.1 GDP-mannose 4,6-dehydratase [Stutzerimonas stutzeri]
MQRTLITGANGFVGQQLCRLLQQSGHHVIAVTSRAGRPVPFAQETFSCDIREAQDIGQIVRETAPSHIVHLAAITHVPRSFEVPQNTWQTNVMGSINVLEAVRSFAPKCFILFVSSGDVYGAAFKQNVPLDESVACLPQNPYAASKFAAETAFYEYFRRGIRGVVARPFNHIGAHQSPDFVTASYARQIALIEADKQEPILRVGDLQASRDFLDVADVCRAYERLLTVAPQNHDSPKCFNVCSGQSLRVAEVLDTLLQMSRSSITVEQDPARMRPSDIPFAVGDSQRLQRLSGWAPTTNLNDTLRHLLNYWRAEVAAG